MTPKVTFVPMGPESFRKEQTVVLIVGRLAVDGIELVAEPQASGLRPAVACRSQYQPALSGPGFPDWIVPQPAGWPALNAVNSSSVKYSPPIGSSSRTMPFDCRDEEILTVYWIDV